METLGLYNCTVNTYCDEFPASKYCWSCVYISSPPPSPPPPPPPHLSSQNHLTPYLVTGVCALGVAFLILTTCAILLRWRWSRRRNSVSAPSSGDEVFLDEDHIGPVEHPIWRIVTVGLPESVIDSITAVKYKKGDGLIEGSDCSVCLTEFEDGDELRLLPKCSHAFHLNCVDTWLRSHKNCPLCRAPVVNDSSVLNLTGLGPNLSEPGSSASARMGILEADLEEQSEGCGTRDGVGDFGCTLPLGGIRIDEILKNNWGNRALSDLGGNRGVQSGDLLPVRMSISLDVSAAAAMNNAVAVNNVVGEGSSNQEKLAELKEVVEQERRDFGSSMSRLMKSSSIGRSLQKAPVSMKRSFSSSARILSSFRGSKRHSSSSILPL